MERGRYWEESQHGTRGKVYQLRPSRPCTPLGGSLDPGSFLVRSLILGMSWVGLPGTIFTLSQQNVSFFPDWKGLWLWGFPETFSFSPHAVPSVREDKVRPRVLRG